MESSVTWRMTQKQVSGRLAIRLFGSSGNLVAEGAQNVSIGPRSTTRTTTDSAFGEFRDLTYAYRFGPLMWDVSVELVDSNERVVPDATFLPGGQRRDMLPSIGLAGTAEPTANGVAVTIHTGLFAHFVSIEIPGFTPEHNWFHMPPTPTEW